MTPIRSLAAAFAVATIASTASAADLPSRKVAPVMAPVPVMTWSGFYVGINAGYAWNAGGVSSLGTPGPCDPAAGGGCALPPTYSVLASIGATFGGNAGQGGFIGGGQVGWNWQSGAAVFGLETDIQGLFGARRQVNSAMVVPSPAFPAQPQIAFGSASASLDFLGTLRGRAGFLVTPSTLLYATGGLAYGSVRVGGNYAQTCVGCNWTIPPVASGSGSTMRIGWTLGAGAEWKFAQNWSLKGEYLYYDLGAAKRTIAIIGTNPANGPLFLSSFPTVTANMRGHVVRAGLNYHFGGAAAPVVAKY